MKKIYGNAFLGTWFLNNPDFSITPKALREQEDEFEWKPSNPKYPNNLYPFKDGQELEYDEEA